MNMPNALKTESAIFFDAFMGAWGETIEERKNELGAAALMSLYTSSPAWTAFMLARPPENRSAKTSDNEREGVLGRAMKKYGELTKYNQLDSKYEWSKYDLLGVRQISPLPDGLSEKGKKEGWLRFVEVAVEHENGDDVETEIWKLCQLRAKLKVLVFYNFGQEIIASQAKDAQYSDTSFANKMTKKEWLSKKLDLLGKIVSGANKILPKEEAEYLLIVGSRTKEDGVKWCAFGFDGDAFSDCTPN
jgi:hypothetical protein